jgi:hypothetical protein
MARGRRGKMRKAAVLLVAVLFAVGAPAQEAATDTGGMIRRLLPGAGGEEPAAPKVPPFEIPTFDGQKKDFKGATRPFTPIKKIDSDAILETVINCYPARSRWKIDVDLQASVRNTNAYDVTNSTIGRSMVGVVFRMPLYSDSEFDRERQRELQRRNDTARQIASFIGSIARRNAAVRTLSLSSMMEQRAQVRVNNGITEADEQTKWLAEVVKAENDLITAEANIEQARMMLAAQCREDAAPTVNDYLKRLMELK